MRNMKMKIQNKEQKTAFAARVVNSQDDWLSTEELYELIDKRSVRTRSEERRVGKECRTQTKTG